MKSIIIAFFIGLPTLIFSQENKQSFFKHVDRKGEIFLTWGWNRSQYTDSDIHFKGDGYKFTLNNVTASDRPSPLSAETYLDPRNVTIPQYQYRIGYYINDHYAISFGFNHMKYVMDQNQTVKIDGHINTPEAGDYNGTYNNDDIELTTDFLTLEHTDGLNFLSFQLDRIDAFWVSKNKKHSLNLTEGFALGMMFPRSDVNLFGEGKNEWHIAGYGISAHVGLRFDFFKYLYIQGQLEGGFIDLPDIITTGKEGAKAKQNFFFLEQMIMIGGYIPIFVK